jgi:thioredoxin reductase
VGQGHRRRGLAAGVGAGVGPRWSARSHELRDLLGRNNIAHGFYDAAGEDGRRLLAQVGLEAGGPPVLLLFDGRVLVDPPNEQVAQALGAKTRPAADRYDLAVVGAGPAGLAAATYAASEGLATLLLEREATGGQAGTTSLIRNYLGFPRGVSGGELAARAVEQAVVFGAELVYAQPATRLQLSSADRVLTLADGSQAVSRTVIIATGVSYRRLPVPGLDALLGAGVFYGAAVTEAKAMSGQRVVVVGGANSAGQAAVHLARHAEQVTLLHRGGSLASGMSAYLVQELERAGNIMVRLHTEVAAAHGAGQLEALTLRNNTTGTTETLPAAALFILIGAEPHTDWLAATLQRDERGFILTGRDLLRVGAAPEDWPLDRPPLLLETSPPPRRRPAEGAMAGAESGRDRGSRREVRSELARLGAPQDRRDDACRRPPGVHLHRSAGPPPARTAAADRVPGRPQIVGAAAEAGVPRPTTPAEPGLADGLLRVRDRPRRDLADLRSHRLRHQVLPRRHRHPDVSRPGCARLPPPGRCRGRTGPRPRRPPCRPRRDGRRRRRRLRDR